MRKTLRFEVVADTYDEVVALAESTLLDTLGVTADEIDHLAESEVGIEREVIEERQWDNKVVSQITYFRANVTARIKP